MTFRGGGTGTQECGAQVTENARDHIAYREVPVGVERATTMKEAREEARGARGDGSSKHPAELYDAGALALEPYRSRVTVTHGKGSKASGGTARLR